MNKSIIVSILIFLLVIINSIAIVITPIDKEISYSPNKEDSCGFSVKTNEGTIISFRATGDLNESINISVDSINAERDKWYGIPCKIILPPNLKPGPHEVDILSIEGRQPGSGVSAAAGVIYPVRTFVPYPGKYIEIKRFKVNDIKVNDTAVFLLDIISRSTDKITNLNAEIKIFGSDSKALVTLTTNTVDIVTDERATLTASWNSTGADPGIYGAKATIKYDIDKETATDANFRVGQIRIDIGDINYENLKKDTIAKFNVNLRSVWNSVIDDVYVLLTIFDKDNKQIGEVRSESFSINAWSSLVKPIFWDTKNVLPGHYKGNFTVYHSSGKSSEKQIEFDVTENYQVVTIILVAVILLLLLALIYNLINRKKNEKEK